MRVLLACIAAVAVATVIPSQSPKSPSPGSTGATAGGKSDVSTAAPSKSGPDIRPRVLRTGFERDPAAEAGKRPAAAAGVAKFNVACSPRAVPAGGEATMVVVMTLAGDAVMPDPPSASFVFERQQGALTIVGEPRFRPAARPGSQPALKGLPHYDDFAILDVPFAVAAGAEAGEHRLELTFRYELLNGKRGGVLGPFTDSLGIDVQVVHAPTAPDAAGAVPEATAARLAAGSAATADGAGDGATGADRSSVPTTVPADAPRTAEPPPNAPPPTPEPPLALLLAAGALLGLLVVVALQRARRSRLDPARSDRGAPHA